MIRTQLILDNQTKQLLENLSLELGRSMSDIAREILQKEITKKQKVKSKKQKDESGIELLNNWTKSSVKGPGDSEYDKYAYNL